MKLKKTFITIGVLIIIVSLLGIPSSWRHYIVIFLGLIVIALSLLSDYLPEKVSRVSVKKEKVHISEQKHKEPLKKAYPSFSDTENKEEENSTDEGHE